MIEILRFETLHYVTTLRQFAHTYVDKMPTLSKKSNTLISSSSFILASSSSCCRAVLSLERMAFPVSKSWRWRWSSRFSWPSLALRALASCNCLDWSSSWALARLSWSSSSLTRDSAITCTPVPPSCVYTNTKTMLMSRSHLSRSRSIIRARHIDQYTAKLQEWPRIVSAIEAILLSAFIILRLLLITN